MFLKLEVIDKKNCWNNRTNLEDKLKWEIFDSRADLRAAHGLFMAEWLHLLPLSSLSALKQFILGKNWQELRCYMYTSSCNIIQGMHLLCFGQFTTSGVKVQLVRSDWKYRGNTEVSGLTLDLSASILKCQGTEIFLSVQGGQQINSSENWHRSAYSNHNFSYSDQPNPKPRSLLKLQQGLKLTTYRSQNQTLHFCFPSSRLCTPTIHLERLRANLEL